MIRKENPTIFKAFNPINLIILIYKIRSRKRYVPIELS